MYLSAYLSFCISSIYLSISPCLLHIMLYNFVLRKYRYTNVNLPKNRWIYFSCIEIDHQKTGCDGKFSDLSKNCLN